jgi:phosphatidylinositol glycan class C protein
MNIVTYEYWDVVVDSAVVTLQITTVASFCSLFAHSKVENISLLVLLSLAMFLGVAGFAFMLSLEKRVTIQRLLSNLQSLFLLFLAVWILSPILKTLTEPLSDDTLLALTITLFAVHLLTQDYAFLSGLSAKFTAPVSLNAAIFASVILVSRLPSVLHVFAIMIIAIELFALFPYLRRSVKSSSTKLHLAFTWSAAAATAALLAPLSSAGAVIYALILVTATFVSPAWLIHLQQYKNTIHGPWDEAVPTRNQAHWKG